MTENDVVELARAVFARRFDLDPATITLEQRIEDLGVDSLDLLTSVADFEATFKIAIPTKEVMQIRTFGDIVQRCFAKAVPSV